MQTRTLVSRAAAGALAILAAGTLQGQTATPTPSGERTLDVTACVASRVGTSIPASAIGEPVSGVSLQPPTWVAPTETAIGQCVVEGSLLPVDTAPTARPILFRATFPSMWNGRAIHLGGGGMNGSLPNLAAAGPIPDADHSVRFGSDSGHQNPQGAGGRGRPGGLPTGPPPAGPQAAGRGRLAGPPTGPDAEWAVNDESIRNFGYMQLKKTHDAVFAIIQRLYGVAPRYTYFVGTSQGGREGLTVAQRYPADYDGVVVQVPVVNFSTLMLGLELIRIQEKPLTNWVTPAKVEAIRVEFMRQCDGLDGAVDGVINNYVGCRTIFDVKSGGRNRHPWAAKRCPNNVDPNPTDTTAAACLTDGQIATLEMTYSPYTFPEPLAHGVKQFGMWVPTIDPSGSGLIQAGRFEGQEGAEPGALKHSALGILGVTGWIQQDLSANPLNFTEAAYAARRQVLSSWADATDPDLSRFSRRGGKLIAVISAQDTLASPGAQLDYYQSILDKMGRSRVDEFARMLVLPQGDHGSNARTATVNGRGEAIQSIRLPSAWDRVGPLFDWVERGVAPPKTITMQEGENSLPLCSYPSYPRYVSGPALQASSYRCTQP